MAAGEAGIGELPANAALETPAAGEMAQGAWQQMAVEAHVDPGVATAAEVAQKHGDGESHVGGICGERSTISHSE